jgi:hypothetical protein
MTTVDGLEPLADCIFHLAFLWSAAPVRRC